MTPDLSQISLRAAAQAIHTGDSVVGSFKDPADGAVYFVAIDPAADVPDTHVEAHYRADGSKLTLISMRRFPNTRVMDAALAATNREPRTANREPPP